MEVLHTIHNYLTVNCTEAISPRYRREQVYGVLFEMARFIENGQHRFCDSFKTFLSTRHQTVFHHVPVFLEWQDIGIV